MFACRSRRLLTPSLVSQSRRCFPHNLHTSQSLQAKPLPPRIQINEKDVTENFIKGGGSGGQKINKTSSKVQLIHHPTGIEVECQATRSRSQNRTLARRILAERIEEQEKGDESRTAIKAKKKQAQKASSMKKKRRKYRKLAEEKSLDAEEAGDEESIRPESDKAERNS